MKKNPKVEAIRNRISMQEAQTQLEKFSANFKSLLLATVSEEKTPSIDEVQYRFLDQKHFVLVTPNLNAFENLNHSQASGWFEKENSENPHPLSKQILKYQFSAKEVDNPNEIFKTLSNEDIKSFKHLLHHHHAKLFQLVILSGEFSLGFLQNFIVNAENQLIGLGKGHHGEDQFENSRLILMAYGEKERVMSAYIEDEKYYVLTKNRFKKVNHFQNNPLCMVYDGKDHHFKTQITINQNPSDIATIFKKFVETQNDYFTENKDLVLLEFSR